MVALLTKGFRGEVPRYSNRLLQPNQAQRALNCRITSGRLDPLRGLSLVHTSLASAVQSFRRYRVMVANAPVDNWLVWGSDVDAVDSPVANDTLGRFYFTGDGEPRMSSYADAISGGGPYPAAWWVLGVAAPVTAPNVSVAGGLGSTESRAYVYTFVTRFGEESGPSPAKLASGANDGTWNLSAMDAAPPNTGTVTAAVKDTPVAGQVTVTLDTVFGVAADETLAFSGVVGMTDLNATFRLLSLNKTTKQAVVALATTQTYTSGGAWTRKAPHNTTSMVKRIYRTAGTNAEYQFVAEIPVATTTYADTVAGTALGEVLATAATLPPPKRLTCLLALPNGCLAGIADNELCLSAPYMPYSWPLSNRYSFAGRGVALVAAGNSVVVLTDSAPILFTGSDPEAMSPSSLGTYAPCMSKRGVVDMGGACLYPSHDGLWLVTPGEARKVTANLYRKDEWAALTPSTFVAEFHDGQYYAQHDGTPTARMWVLDMAEPDSAVQVDERVDALYRNPYDGKLYVAKGQKLYQWDADDGARYESDWMSPVYQLARPSNMAVAQVHAEFGQIIPLNTAQQDANAAMQAAPMAGGGQIAGLELNDTEVNGSALVPVAQQTQRRVQFTLYKDGAPIYTRQVDSVAPFRLPAGYLTELFSYQISASVPTYSVAVGESMADLKGLNA